MDVEVPILSGASNSLSYRVRTTPYVKVHALPRTYSSFQLTSGPVYLYIGNTACTQGI